MLLTQSKFAEVIGISRQAIAKAVEGRRLEKTGTKIDTSSALNTMFIESKPAYQEKFKSFLNGLDTDKKPKPKKAEKIEASADAPMPSPEQLSGDDQSMSFADVTRATAEAKMQKMRNEANKSTLELEKMRNNLAERDILSFVIERFLNHFATGIKRVSNTSLRDIAKEILARGTIENPDYMRFEDACMELVDTAKTKVSEDLKNHKI